MVQFSHVIIRLALGATLVTPLVILQAKAELLVSSTRGIEGVADGTAFPDDYVFKLPANAELKLRNSQTNATYVMRGPFEGTLAHFVESCSGILASLHRYCRESDAGLPIGGVRGARPPHQSLPPPEQ